MLEIGVRTVTRICLRECECVSALLSPDQLEASKSEALWHGDTRPYMRFPPGYGATNRPF
jgi:hypothetical protein